MPEIISNTDTSDNPPTPLAVGERMNAQYVELTPGWNGDGHSHPHEQFTYVVDGALTIVVDGVDHDISAGDSLVIPGDVTHFARNEGDETAVLLDVFSPVRDDII
jgi:quercetin dioxygenase-like cupin family protein